MHDNRSRILPALAATLGVLLLGGCSTIDINEHCRYTDNAPVSELNTDSLAMLLGAPAGQAKDSPFVVFSSATDPDIAVRFDTRVDSLPLPADLDESRCSGVDWKTYRLDADADQWSAFLEANRGSRFEIAVGFLDEPVRLRLKEVGVALYDPAAAATIVACGCYTLR